VLRALALLLVHHVMLVITSLVMVLVAQVVFHPIVTLVLLEITQDAVHVNLVIP
jgi:hypothetical protein